jgi:hypothetical protein
MVSRRKKILFSTGESCGSWGGSRCRQIEQNRRKQKKTEEKRRGENKINHYGNMKPAQKTKLHRTFSSR